MSEKWSKIKDFENYEVSSIGRVRNLSTHKIIKPRVEAHGYYEHRIYKNGKRFFKKAHRLVATAFIPNPDSLATVNHKNGNKKDNRIENLEWMSLSDNAKHSIYVLGNNNLRRGGNGGRSVKVRCVETGEVFDSIIDASKKYGGHQGNISRSIKTGWSVYGYHWIIEE